MSQSAQPGSAADALASVAAGLSLLTGLDAAELTAAEQADCLRALERAHAQLLAARSAVLTAFTAARGFEDDGAGGPRPWLRWQTRITTAAACDAVAWTQRLAGHPAITTALAAGQVSVSWARKICWWTDRLPADARGDADQILLDAAAGGAGLRDLSGLAEEIHRATAGPDTDNDDGFDRRNVRLATHFRGAGKLDGDLTPECAAALRAVLDSLSAKAGPEDIRTAAQRQHDALAAACHRLISGGLPDRAGQPTQIHLHMSLSQLLGQPGADDATADWAGHAPAAGPGADCDAAISPIVTAHLDPAELDGQTRDFLHATGTLSGPGCPAAADQTASGARWPPGRDPAPATARWLTPRPAASSSAGRSGCCRVPAASPRTSAVSCSPSPPPASASPSTSAGPPTPSRRACAAPSPPATNTAGSPAATSSPPTARPIT